MDDLSDVSKMKVAELKKHLKLRGLSVAGNKNELIERLQTSLESGDDTIGSADVLDDAEEDFDEEAILGNTDVSDLAKITPQEEDAMLMDTVKPDETTAKPKITLKRSEPCLSEVVSSDKENEKSTEESTTGEEGSEPAIKKIKIDGEFTESPGLLTSKVQNMTAEERRAARIARFGIVEKETKNGSKDKSLNVEALKKRADRFGEVTSKNLQKEKTSEAIQKRKERFGISTLTSSTPELEEKKKKRAERFGI